MSEFNAIGNIPYTTYVMGRILYLYYTDPMFQESVKKIIEHPHILNDPVWSLELSCMDIAKQFVEGYDALLKEGVEMDGCQEE